MPILLFVRPDVNTYTRDPPKGSDDFRRCPEGDKLLLDLLNSPTPGASYLLIPNVSYQYIHSTIFHSPCIEVAPVGNLKSPLPRGHTVQRIETKV